jgi:hypothetical protein
MPSYLPPSLTSGKFRDGWCTMSEHNPGREFGLGELLQNHWWQAHDLGRAQAMVPYLKSLERLWGSGPSLACTHFRCSSRQHGSGFNRNRTNSHVQTWEMVQGGRPAQLRIWQALVKRNGDVAVTSYGLCARSVAARVLSAPEDLKYGLRSD